MTDTDLIWLAGWLEGEGCFSAGTPSHPNTPRIQAVTTDEDVAAHVGSLLDRKVLKRESKNPRHKTQYRITIAGSPAIELMTKLRPLMHGRRKDAIDRAISTYSEKPHPGRFKGTLSEDEARFIYSALVEGQAPAPILKDFYRRFNRAITRDVVRSVRRGYRTHGLAPVRYESTRA